MAIRKSATLSCALSALVGWTALSVAAEVNADIIEFTITLDGTQQANIIETTGSGAGTATLDLDTNLFSWDITFADLLGNETAAHFHGPAPLCQNAGIQIGLPLGSNKVGSQVITNGQAEDLLAGLWYVNIHSSEFGGGEIRGQVMPSYQGSPFPDPIGPSTIHLDPVVIATGLTAPNWGTTAPGIDGRLFVTDQDGIIWNVDLVSGTTSVMLDVSTQLVDLGLFGEGSFDERGLLGIAFHPNYATNGRLYTYQSEPVNGTPDFTTMPGGTGENHHSMIIEWQVVDASDPDTTVNMSTRRELLRIAQPQFNHNAGAIAFGPDGLLYIALGDGGGADDKDGQSFIGEPIVGHGCLGNGQDTSNPLGSILRIDPLGNNSGNGAYGIPADNPFVGAGDPIDEIFAYGFRNPFRMSFDTDSGLLYVADVGQNDVEEIAIVSSGSNHGWPAKEGSLFFVQNGALGGYPIAEEIAAFPGLGVLTDPIAEYDHDEGIAIVGGFVYHGSRIPALQGRYVFGEFARSFSNDGRLFHLDGANTIVEFNLAGKGGFAHSVLGFAQDEDGEVYALANMTGTPFGDTGVILKLVPRTGDVDANGIVDVNDLLELLAQWGPCGGCAADFDGDGDVDVDDLLALLGGWG